MWWREYQIIRSFFQFWQSRNKLVRLPMPRPQAVLRPPFRPYILSKTELLRLLMAIELTPLLDPMTMRTFLLFLYGTGARVRETIGLRTSDIDFRHGLVTLRQATERADNAEATLDSMPSSGLACPHTAFT
jgi:integrase